MINVDPPAIRALGTSIQGELTPVLASCVELLASARQITHSNFTSVTPHLAVAYLGAVEFAEEQLRSKREHLDEMRSRLARNAENWEAADACSTISFR
ncbi:hypothetical protein [Melissospora conviva]|uniref:hypothetical protein n=1 Tax=Melissospora conviva TaxID=3388432 RepID=UPI003B7F8298